MSRSTAKPFAVDLTSYLLRLTDRRRSRIRRPLLESLEDRGTPIGGHLDQLRRGRLGYRLKLEQRCSRPEQRCRDQLELRPGPLLSVRA